jgi:hypothetical protein
MTILPKRLNLQPKRVLPTAQEVIAKYLSAVGANRQEVFVAGNRDARHGRKS